MRQLGSPVILHLELMAVLQVNPLETRVIKTDSYNLQTTYRMILGHSDPEHPVLCLYSLAWARTFSHSSLALYNLRAAEDRQGLSWGQTRQPSLPKLQ